MHGFINVSTLYLFSYSGPILHLGIIIIESSKLSLSLLCHVWIVNFSYSFRNIVPHFYLAFLHQFVFHKHNSAFIRIT